MLVVPDHYRETEEWIRTASDREAFRLGCYFDLDAALRVAQFAERFARHTTAKWAGRPFVLLRWQFYEFVAPLYGWKRPDGTRRFRKFGLGIPKKNGKSTLASLLTVYHMIADGEASAECYLCASDVDQARIVYREAAKFVNSSRHLRSVVKVVDYRSRLTSRRVRDASFTQVLSREAATKHGYNASYVLFDEFHTQRTWDLWNVMKYAGRARNQPLVGWISTAGNNVELPWFTEWEYARGIEAGTIVDPWTFAKIYETPESADPEDESHWIASNPSIGEVFTIDDMRADYAEAKAKGPIAFRDFRQLQLNQVVKGGLDWIQRDKWDTLAADDGKIEFPKLTPVDGGLDLASTRDFNALVLMCREPSGRYLHKAWFWRPELGGAGNEEANVELYRQWAARGFVKLTPGDYIDVDTLYRDILDICRTHQVKQLAFDPYNAGPLVPRLQAAGVKMIDFRQNRLNFNGPTREFERVVFNDSIRHQGNPVMSWMVANTVIAGDAAGNMMPSRSESRAKKIDGVPASIMALALQMQRAQVRPFTGF